MGKEAALGAARRFRDRRTARGVHVERMILFGSHATGHAREWSDIDLVVISPHFAGRGLWDRIKWTAPAIREADAPIEAVYMTPQEWESGKSLIVQFASTGEEV
jgi:uncharacterized protein